MRVGLNLVFLVPGETGGMETYARELIPELVAAAPQAQFTAFVNREAAAAGEGPWGEVIPAVTVPVRARSRVEWVRGEQQLLPRLAARAGIELVHSLASTAPAWGRFRRVVTIHDLNYRIVPEAHLGGRGLGMRVLVPLAARRSQRILVDSHSTGQDVERFLHIPSAQIDVVPLGVSARVAEPAGDIEASLRADGRPIALCVAAKRPHKNLLRLLDALALIPTERRPLLVLPGYPTSHEQDLRKRAEKLEIADSVRFLGWITASELEALYAAAACFVFPSLYEGFGLPVLEAMARGVPVACSHRGSLAEVADDAALRFNPESAREIAQAMERLVSDRSEADRLSKAGRQNALKFSWKATATGTIACYERALAEPSRPDR